MNGRSLPPARPPALPPAPVPDIAAAALDARGTVTAWSHGAERLLGYTAGESLGRRAADFLCGGLPAAARRSTAEKQAWAGRIALRDRDGDRLEAEVRACPLADAQGLVQWYLQVSTPPDGADSPSLALQRSLLPRRPPDTLAVETATRYLPADPRFGVGGDWYDVIPLSGARIALVAGDVVGHGIHASAAMGRLRMAVRTLADVDLPPDELLAQLDDLILGEVEEGIDTTAEIGATCVYAVYDPTTLRCVIASAGHPAPISVSPRGTARNVDIVPGPPLGVGGVPFEATDVDLAEGGLLVLYTNGLVATDDGDVDGGTEALMRALSEPAASLETSCDRVVAALPHDRPDDDAALLIARTRRLGSGHVASREIAADPAVLADARGWAADQLSRWHLQESALTTELVVSELVTNAIRYASPPIRLRLIHDSTLICEVSDGSSTSPHSHRARDLDEGGRGLFLVGRLTNRWGTRHTPTGKTVWAEQLISGAAGSDGARPLHAVP